MIYFRFYNFNTNNSIHHSLKLFGYSVWAFYCIKGFGWFRLFGNGITWKNTAIYCLLFSERNGHKRGFNIGKWRIGITND